MSDRLPAGPYRTLDVEGGAKIPYYIIPFDKRGVTQGPETQKHLLASLANNEYTDVFLFSHGWNNDWSTSTSRYESFIEGYMKMRAELALPVPGDYKPLLVGIFWPSTALVFTDAERGPDFAAGKPAAIDDAVAEERREVAELAEDLDPDQAEIFYSLAQKETLTQGEARQLAEIATVFYNSRDDELGLDTTVTADEVLEIWAAAPDETDDPIDDLVAGGGGGGPQAAGVGSFLRRLDPRKIVRALTVYQIKDRAGTVGANGVSKLLRGILDQSEARVHLAGHSYGAKVVLSAISAGDQPSRKVRSMLLLQPAVSHLCFAEQVPGTSRAGGYRPALERVENPILSTFSDNDVALTKAFHLAVRRAGDLGEAKIAASQGNPPSRFAALGGFGPRNAGQQLIDILDAGADYELDPAVEIYGIDGTRTIGGHGDISNRSTWWALYTLASL